MSKLFVIGDLHFSLGTNKPMDIFGKAWENHTERICENWRRTVSSDDYVVVNGDISWGMGMDEAVPDLILLDSLPGKKIIMKGNHELWWTTLSKLTNVLRQYELKTIFPLYNNAYFWPGKKVLICGTRGWLTPGDDEFKEADAKVFRRELMRFEMSLNYGRALSNKYFDVACKITERANIDCREIIGYDPDNVPNEISREYETIAFTHYPPFVFTKRDQTDFTDLIAKSGVSRCYFGHVHGVTMKEGAEGGSSPVYRCNRVGYFLTAADYLKMEPALVCGDAD